MGNPMMTEETVRRREASQGVLRSMTTSVASVCVLMRALLVACGGNLNCLSGDDDPEGGLCSTITHHISKRKASKGSSAAYQTHQSAQRRSCCVAGAPSALALSLA